MFLEECEKHFECTNLYDIFGVPREASSADVKKGYYKLSMKWHPDKAGQTDEEKKIATIKFQLISKAYEILSDESKRVVYDETGSVDEELGSSDFESALSLWRKVFKKVTKKDIDSYLTTYRGSDDEQEDIIKTFKRFDGNVDKMMNYLVGAENEHEHRILEIIDTLIGNGELEKTADYSRTTSEKNVKSRKKKAAKEKAVAARASNRESENATSLEQMILSRQQNRNSILDQIAEKYAKMDKPKRKSTKKDIPKPKKSKLAHDED